MAEQNLPLPENAVQERRALLEIENLRKYFPVKAGLFQKKYVLAVE